MTCTMQRYESDDMAQANVLGGGLGPSPFPSNHANPSPDSTWGTFSYALGARTTAAKSQPAQHHVYSQRFSPPLVHSSPSGEWLPTAPFASHPRCPT